MEQTPIGLVIGMPSRGLKVGFHWAIYNWMINFPLNTHRAFYFLIDKPIDQARNALVKHAINAKAKYIWFLDDDVQCPPNVVRRLMYDLEQADDDVAVAMGIYPSKEIPAEPMIFNGDGVGAFWKWKKGEVFEVSGGGTGCMMIKTEIFQHIPEPWFKTVDEPATHEVNKNVMTDDLYFCRKVREAGYKLIADGNVLCVHYDYATDPPTAYALPPDSYPFKEEANADNPEPASLSAAAG